MGKKTALALFIVLAALSSVAIVATVSSISVSSDVSVAGVSGFSEDNVVCSGFTMGDPKPGGWA